MSWSTKNKIEEPNPNTPIWKYFDLAKYLALLKTRCLHMSPTTEFWDRYEGDIGIVQKKALIRKHGEEEYKRAMEFFDKLRERTYVSCWTENEFESDAMWRIYTGASYGVAVRSTYGRLRSLLPSVDDGLVSYCGRVRYVDFKKDLLELDAYHVPYFFKRRSFEHEREIRMILQDQSQASAAVDGKDAADPVPKKIPLTAEQLSDLILSVHLSPGAPSWFKDLVCDVNRDYGLDRDPLPSALDETPD